MKISKLIFFRQLRTGLCRDHELPAEFSGRLMAAVQFLNLATFFLYKNRYRFICGVSHAYLCITANAGLRYQAPCAQPLAAKVPGMKVTAYIVQVK